ncbi:MAG: hypothetical protein AAGE96_09435 [Cyanobacteria bacterium P01_G01_bin.19]
MLTRNGLAQDLLANTAIKTERSRSSLIALLVEQEASKLEEAKMIADAVEIDNCQLGWSEEEQGCQIIDMEHKTLFCLNS